MDYGRLLNRTWTLVWEHKFLILLGILVALSGSGGSGAISGGSRSLPRSDQEWHGAMPPAWPELPISPMQKFELPAYNMPVALVLVGLALVVALAVWAVSTLARGALIAGASAADSGGVTNFGEAFALAWRKGWALLGIGVFSAIPTLVLLLGALGAAAVYIGAPPVINGQVQSAGLRTISILLTALTCVALPFALCLNLLRTFAERACMLEGRGVLAAFGRGFRVLVDNAGSALLLFLIQVGIGIGLGLALLLPALCCVLWPLLLVAQGMAAAFFSTMWTLAWRRWTNAVPVAGEAFEV